MADTVRVGRLHLSPLERLEMKPELVYVELKTGQSDRGPAWIGFAERSKSGKTVYFNDQAFQSCKGRGVGANFFDLESGDEYWISGVKRDLSDRHWAGTGPIRVERRALGDYLRVVGLDALPKTGYELVDLRIGDVKERIEAQQNSAQR